MMKQFFTTTLLAIIFIATFQACEEDPTTLNKQDHIFGSMTDIDGNVYQTVIIGNQEWMAENLKVTHYRNGDTIPNVTSGAPGTPGPITGAYFEYNNDANNVATYGRLYNWYAVNDSRNIAPAGWHVPTRDEWLTLVEYLGGYDVAGGKLKEAGTAHCNSPNTSATNESGFTALPGGYCYYGSYSFQMGSAGYFWTSEKSNVSTAWGRELSCTGSEVYRVSIDKRLGLSIRCVRD